MKNQPKVSVVVPCFNMQNYLPNCFKSLQNQTYDNLEIIFVNDGSTDNTLQELKTFCTSNPSFVCKNLRLKLIDQPNGGLSNARNSGLKQATGDYIYFFDPDDILHPQAIKSLVNAVLQNNAGIAVCKFVRTKDNKKYENYKFKKRFGNKVEFFDKIQATEQYLSQKKFDYCVWNKIYSAKILKDNNIFFIDNCRYGEDTNFNYLYLKHINKLVYIHKNLYFYVQRKNSLFHQNFNPNRLDAFYCLNSNIKDSKQSFPEVYSQTMALRTMVCCEILFSIYKSPYANTAVISKILEYLNAGIPHLKRCGRIALYRRVLIPIAPTIARLLLGKRAKAKPRKSDKLPPSMQIL